MLAVRTSTVASGLCLSRWGPWSCERLFRPSERSTCNWARQSRTITSYASRGDLLSPRAKLTISTGLSLEARARHFIHSNNISTKKKENVRRIGPLEQSPTLNSNPTAKHTKSSQPMHSNEHRPDAPMIGGRKITPNMPSNITNPGGERLSSNSQNRNVANTSYECHQTTNIFNPLRILNALRVLLFAFKSWIARCSLQLSGPKKAPATIIDNARSKSERSVRQHLAPKQPFSKSRIAGVPGNANKFNPADENSRPPLNIAPHMKHIDPSMVHSIQVAKKLQPIGAIINKGSPHTHETTLNQVINNELKHAPGVPHDLKRAFKNTPITPGGTRGQLRRRTLGLVKSRTPPTLPEAFSITEDLQPMQRDSLLPPELEMRQEPKRSGHRRAYIMPPNSHDLRHEANHRLSNRSNLTGLCHNVIITPSEQPCSNEQSQEILDEQEATTNGGIAEARMVVHNNTIKSNTSNDTGLLLPHELAARLLLKQNPTHNEPSKRNDQTPRLKSRSIGNMLTGSNSPLASMHERGLKGPNKMRNGVGAVDTLAGVLKIQEINWDSLIERPHHSETGIASPIRFAANVDGSVSAASSNQDIFKKANENANIGSCPRQTSPGRRSVPRRPIVGTPLSRTPAMSVTESLNLDTPYGFILGSGTDGSLPREIQARDTTKQSKGVIPTTTAVMRPISLSNGVEFYSDTSLTFQKDPAMNSLDADEKVHYEATTAHVISRNSHFERTSPSSKPSAVDVALSRSTPRNLASDTTGQFKGLFNDTLVPASEQTRHRDQSSARGPQVRRSIKRRSGNANAGGIEISSSQTGHSYSCEVGFSWDSWSDGARDWYRDAEQLPRPSISTGGRGEDKFGKLNFDWGLANRVNNAKHQEHDDRVDKTDVDSYPISTHIHTEQQPQASSIDSHASGIPISIIDTSLDDCNDTKRIRGRDRRYGRQARYEDSFENITEEYIRASKTRDKDRIKDRGQNERDSARGARWENEFDNKEDWEDEWEERQQRRQVKRLRKEQETMAQSIVKIPQITIPEFIAVEDLARALDTSPSDLARALVDFGFESLTTKSVLTGETAGLIAQEYGYETSVDEGQSRDLKPLPPPDDASILAERPPVVAIMGHVDHGKTTLLDYFRKSSITATEFGGITQHIGAFMVPMPSGKVITFLDTPGHSAFLAMRQRGANATDIVILVVAADDSVKPQTIEAIHHAKNAKVPIIVAINKIDKPDARLEIVKADLAREGVELEEYGGDVQVVCTSGKTGAGMANLEECILTLSEILNFRADKGGLAEGWIIESSIKQIGKSAVVLVKRGTLRVGDVVVAGTSWARIRLLRNEDGHEIREAPPGTPAEVVGWNDHLPDAGVELLQAPDESKARAAIAYRLEMQERIQSIDEAARQEQRRQDDETQKLTSQTQQNSSGNSESTIMPNSSPKIINYIIKSDVAGSAEAVSGAILQLGNNEVQPRILRSSAGSITEWDVEHAAISGSSIIGFNIAITSSIRNLAQREGVTILEHTVIYHLADEIKMILSSHLPDKITYRVVGEAEVLQIFPINIRGRLFHNIAGCRVRNGIITGNSMARILRNGVVAFEGKIESIRQGKKDVEKCPKGMECGIALAKYENYIVSDIIQTLEEVREVRNL